MLMVTNVWLAFSAALLAIVGWTGGINPLFVLVGVFLIGIGFAFDAPAYTASVADLVGKEDLSSAVTLGGVQMNLSSIIGPAFGGTLVSVIRGRLNAVHMVVSQGGMALGGIGWGLTVGISNVETAFFAAAIALFSVSLLFRPLSIDFTETLDLEPSPLPRRFHRFPRFPKPEDGPVAISVDYHVAEQNRERFLEAMSDVRGLMLRNGASSRREMGLVHRVISRRHTRCTSLRT
jgi:MFS family permease